MSTLSKKILEYRGLRIPEYYNQFFNPNICHVCKSVNVDESSPILCDWCSLVYYCSIGHKMLHYLEHNEICEIIWQVLEIKPQRDTRRYKNWQEWIETRKQLMKAVQQNLNRPLKPYEKQMFLWSKSCYVCHQQTELKTCQRCFSGNYCDEHENVFCTKHDGYNCDQMMLMLNIDIEIISGKTSNISYGFLQLVDEKKCFEEMLEFYIENILKRRRDIDWLAKDYIRSDYLSGPLTVYHGLKKLNILNVIENSRIVIHIIGINSVDKNGLCAWEVLLHFLPKVKHLVIEIIGPKLVPGNYKYNLCRKCKDGKEMSVSVISMLYHHYVKLFKYQKSVRNMLPNAVLGSHLNMNNIDTWLETILEFEDLAAPLLLSFPSAQKAQNVIEKIQDILCTKIDPNYNNRNHFPGLMPHKCIESGNIYFCNEYLVIYDNLTWISRKILPKILDKVEPTANILI
ncbi:uncharacterized protein LOC105188659 [Harpegnathos saltator]|uniref:uncharacterized protein LOC105188659 n=1 Tax=Harpegnathos saltator TaxID=610380 RepID=UPI000DBEEA66|nr:uncharacterized protein LOC105188659 [Harpegnathos saltator]